MAVTKQFTQLDPINNGTSAQDNFKLSDAIPAQHTDLTGGVNKLVHRTLAQSLCEPVAVCNSNNPKTGAYTATCQNYPDFALSYQDAQQNTQYLIGLKIRVIFTYGITYGSVSGGTYPTLNINGSGAIPMLAQGKTMASGAASAGQSIEFTIIPYGKGVAFDADSNVRESTSDYTIYTDGKKYNKRVITNSVFLKNYGTQQSTFDLSSLRNYPYRNFIVIAYDGYHMQEYFWIGVVQVGTNDLTAVNKIFSLSENYNIFKNPDRAYSLTTNNPDIYIYGITVYTVLDPRSYNLAEII